ncbi:MAG: YHS domain-containing protein [Actinomycetota bacterium]
MRADTRTGEGTEQDRAAVGSGMTLGEDAPAQLVHDGHRFFFCSQECLRVFLAEPDRYAPSGAS